MKDEFNSSLADSQATAVTPLTPEQFNIDAYADYAAELDARCKTFWEASSGVLVYRRMRVQQVFAGDCCNMEHSLQWQLGALQQSMKFKADIPNFLEPWYGLGTVASAYGFGYVWEKTWPRLSTANSHRRPNYWPPLSAPWLKRK